MFARVFCGLAACALFATSQSADVFVPFPSETASAVSWVLPNWGGVFTPATPTEINNCRVLMAAAPTSHPRTVLNPTRRSSIASLIGSNPTVAWINGKETAYANYILSSTTPYTVNNVDSRMVQSRILTLSLAYQLTNDVRYADRAKTELMTVCSMANWRPEPNTYHVLSEFAAAAAFGYDWLYNYLTVTERQTVRTAILNKALIPAVSVYRSGTAWWLKSGLNITMVCNSGLLVAALAICSEESTYSPEVMANAIRCLSIAKNALANDGGWIEHHGYWMYGIHNFVMGLDALDTTLGNTMGLMTGEPLKYTGLYKVFAGGPGPRGAQCANFGETYPDTEASPCLLWIAAKTDQPGLSAFHHLMYQNNFLTSPWDMLWYSAPGAATAANLPKAMVFRNVNQFFARSSWTATQPVAVMFKGGDNTANHNQQDLGQFMVEMLGQRWFVDPGPTSPYQPGPNGKYFRNMTQAHNTLRFALKEQSLTDKAPLVAASTKSANMFAVADLTDAAGGAASSWQRGISMRSTGAVLIQDDFLAYSGCRVDWAAHTKASIKVSSDRRVVWLTQAGKTVTVAILAPSTAKFSASTVYIAAPEASIPGLKRLSVTVYGTNSMSRLAVGMLSGNRSLADFSAISVQPLTSWVSLANSP